MSDSRVVKGLVEAAKNYVSNYAKALELSNSRTRSMEERQEFDALVAALRSNTFARDFAVANGEVNKKDLEDLFCFYDTKICLGDKKIIFSDDSLETDNQEKAINFWNGQGRIMAGLADYYFGSKQIQYELAHGTAKEFRQASLLLRKIGDRFSRRVITDDRLSNKVLEDTTIIRHYGCAKKGLSISKNFRVEEYSRLRLSDAISNNEILSILQFLCNTYDNMQEILSNLGFLSGVATDRIYFWTALLPHRVSNNQMVISLVTGNGDFDIHCDSFASQGGLSHRVHYVSLGEKE